MKKIRLFLIGLSLSVLAFSGACNDNSNQETVNLETQDLVASAEVLASTLATDSCADLVASVNDFVSTAACDNNGTFSITVSSVTCEDGPPLTASFSVTLTFDNCELDNETGDGSIIYNFSLDGNSGTITLTSAGFTFEGVTYYSDDFTMDIDLSTDTASQCSGMMNVDGSACDISSDCTSCNF